MHSAVKNIIAVLSGDIYSKILAIITTAILARYLGPEEYGKYCFILSFAFIFIVIADFGLNDLIIRDIARNRSLAPQYLSLIILIKSAFSFISIALFVFSIFIMGYPREIIDYSVAFSASIIFITFVNSASSMFKAFERMQYSSLILMVNSSLFLLFIATLIYIKGTLLQIILSRVMALCIGSMIAFILLIKIVTKPEYTINLSFIKRIAKSAFPFLAIGLIHSLYFNLDVIMLSKMKGPLYVGWFAPAANDLFFSIMIIPAAISTVTYPIFSRQYHESIEKFRESFNFTVKISIIIGVAISAGTFMLAADIIYLFFGTEYDNSVDVLRIIALAICFVFVGNAMGFGLASVGRVKTLMWLNIISLGLNAALNLALIPIYAHIGASVTSVTCIFTSFLLSYYFLNREVRHLILFRYIFKPAVAAALMSTIIFMLKGSHVLILIIIGAIVYIILLLVMKTLTQSDINILKKSFKKA